MSVELIGEMEVLRRNETVERVASRKEDSAVPQNGRREGGR